MFLFVGLGNPGTKYASNRHNIGFMAVDVIAAAHKFSPWKKKFQGEICDGTLAGEKVLLLKPQTFMNESGRSVGEAVRFHNVLLGIMVFAQSRRISRQSLNVCGSALATRVMPAW
jgi:peptidyl-tRNA hydrolase, PTH1 family